MTSLKRLFLATLITVSLLGLAVTAHAAKDQDNSARFVHVSWTGVTIKTELATTILQSLGYDAESLMVSVPIAYKAMSMNEADIFLGNWMPSMASIAEPFFEDGSVVKYVANMDGAKYTLAVPTYVYEGGLTHFKDIQKYADKLDHKIYGIEEGNDGNLIIQNMIDNDMYGLGDFELVPSSEAGMLGQVKAFARDKEWVVFLGWAPHSMNERIDMKYLKGSTPETFGGNDGTATVYTNTRAGYLKNHPNVATFLENLVFPVSMMNQIMLTLHENQDLSPKQAGLNWVKNNPEMYKKWLDGVTTYDGKDALPVWEKALGKM
jgi:glycine betaine/proline transport system substrate-binding protein